MQCDRFLAVGCCPEGQVALRLNLDESSLKLWPGAIPGTVAAEPGAGSRVEVLTNVSLRAQRGAFSFVAVVCDDPEIQRKLPQFIIASEKLLPTDAAAAFPAAAWPNIVLLRRRSAWLDATSFCEVLRRLSAAVRSQAPGRHCVLSMDACPVHLSPRVLREVGRCQMHFCPIAAHMTRWMQPCDVSVFRPFKHRIRNLYQQEQLLQGKGELSVDSVLRIVARAATDIIGRRPWAQAFRLCGLSPAPPTSRRFGAALGGAADLAFNSGVPSLEQLAAIMPRRRFVAVEDLFASLMRPRPAVRARTAPRPAVARIIAVPGASAPAVDVERPWFGRTRSTSHVHAYATRTVARRVSSAARPRIAAPIPCPRRPRLR